MHNLRFLLFTLSILIFGNISAQNTLISDDPTATTETSAVLNIHSDSKGLLIPRLDKAGRVTMPSPATGLVIFDTSDNIFYFFNGADWEPVHSGDKEFSYWSSQDVIRNINHISADFILGEDRLPGNAAQTETMLFYDKSQSAFRIGSLLNSNAWSPDSIGVNSIGMGTNAKAIGANAVSIGFKNTARGDYATTLGYYNTATGDHTTALGYFNQAKGTYSQASGLATEATGQISATMGNGTAAGSRAVLAIGQYNVGDGSPDDWVETDPLFEIGNGSSYTERENALTVLKNGDFIVGSHQLPNSSDITNTLLFFDHSKKAFRGGSLINSNVWSPDSIGTNSFAYGTNAKANGLNSIALGYGAVAKNDFSVALGRDVISNGRYSTAMGLVTKARGDYSTSLGNYTDATGESSTAMGTTTKAIGKSSTAMGNRSEAIGEFSTAMGSYVNAEAQVNTAIGQYNVGGGDADDWVEIDPLFEIGNGTSDTERENALTILKNGNFILGDHQLPESDPITKNLLFFDQSKGAFRGGGLDDSDSWAPTSIGQYSFGYGKNAKAKGDHSIAIGISAVASSYSAVAIGRETEALGQSSTALGVSTTATGNYSIAMGIFSDAIGTGSTAMGFSSNASGTYSTSMGKGSIALGTHSTAMGFYTHANGENSISMGEETTATGDNSTSMGDHSIALGNQSVALGSFTKADAQASMSIGQYNVGGGNPTQWHSSDPIFEIGNGESEATRANAITVLKNGRVGLQTTNPIGLLHLLYDSENTLSKHHLVIEEIDPDDSAKIKFKNSGNSDSWIVDGLPNEDDAELANFNIRYSNSIGQLTTAARFKGNGDVYINGKLGFGTLSTPTYRLQLPNYYQDDLGEAIAYAWNTYSDARVKTNVHPTTYGLKEVLALNPVSYYHHSSKFENGQLVVAQEEKEETIGFIAQEVYEIIEEVVSKPENENIQLWCMDYEKLTPVLVKAIQQQQTKIELLEKELDETKAIQDQQTKIEILEQKLNETKTIQDQQTKIKLLEKKLDETLDLFRKIAE